MRVSARTALASKGMHGTAGLVAGWILFLASALAFVLFVLVTLYAKDGSLAGGAKEMAIAASLLAALVAWLGTAWWLVGRSAFPLVAASFVPMLSTLPITAGVLGSPSYAREYWIDRSLKVELLLGLPALVLLLHGGIWAWRRYRWSWRAAGPVLGVLAAGFILRYAGTGWGLPFAYQPEESSIYLRWAMELALHGQWNPHYFENPSLLIYLLGFEFLGLFGMGRLLQFGQDPGDLYMVFRGEQDLFYAVARLNSVVLGTLTVLVVFFIGRRLWGQRAGLLAASLLAVNFLHVRNSQYAVNDVPSTFFLVLSLYFSLRLAEEGRWRHYLLAGLMAGLATSTKYNAGLIVVAVAVAHWIYWGKAHWFWKPEAPGRLGLSALVALLGFVVGTPYSVLDFPLFRDGFLSQLGMGQAAWSGQDLAPTLWLYLTGLVHGSGIMASALALLGALILPARDRRRAALLLSFPVCYIAFMSAMDLFFVRWVVPSLPFVALAGAYGLEQAVRAVPWRRQLAEGALIVLALLQPAAYSLRLDWLVHQTDTRAEANRWAELNLPAGSKVAVEAFSLLDQESLAFRATLQQLNVELVWRATMHDLAWYRGNGFDYLAVSSFNYGRAFSQPGRYADRVDFYQQLDRELPLLATFTPRLDGKSTPFALDDTDTPFWHLFSYDRPGPTIKVYQVTGSYPPR